MRVPEGPHIRARHGHEPSPAGSQQRITHVQAGWAWHQSLRQSRRLGIGQPQMCAMRLIAL
eukprot:1153791-Pelagomonas_calceolata.AAC.3